MLKAQKTFKSFYSTNRSYRVFQESIKFTVDLGFPGVFLVNREYREETRRQRGTHCCSHVSHPPHKVITKSPCLFPHHSTTPYPLPISTKKSPSLPHAYNSTARPHRFLLHNPSSLDLISHPNSTILSFFTTLIHSTSPSLFLTSTRLQRRKLITIKLFFSAPLDLNAIITNPSPLDPIIFSLHILDLAASLDRCYFRLFATTTSHSSPFHSTFTFVSLDFTARTPPILKFTTTRPLQLTSSPEPPSFTLLPRAQHHSITSSSTHNLYNSLDRNACTIFLTTRLVSLHHLRAGSCSPITRSSSLDRKKFCHFKLTKENTRPRVHQTGKKRKRK